MDKEEMQHLVLRQLDDILSQIERILCGQADMEILKNFSVYSEELKEFLRNNSANPMILERIELIPRIDFMNSGKSNLFSFALNLLTDSYVKESLLRSEIIEKIKIAREYYSSIQFLYKNEIS